MTISALTLFPRLRAISNALVSSGLGDSTVGKLPSGIFCSSTICTFLNPALFKTSGIRVIEVPCRDVNTIFKLFFILILSDNLPFKTL